MCEILIMGLKQEIDRVNINKIKRIFKYHKQGQEFDCEPLQYACDKENIHIIMALLLEPSIDVNAVTCIGVTTNYTCLEHACRIRREHIVRALLTHPNIQIGRSLQYAAEDDIDNATIINMLISRMSRDNHKVDVTDVLYASCKSGSYENFELLLTHPKTVFDFNKYPLVHVLCQTSHLVELKARIASYGYSYGFNMRTEVDKLKTLLLLNDIDINKQGDDGLTPIQLCATLKDEDKFELLLSDPRCDPYQKTKDGKTLWDIVSM